MNCLFLICLFFSLHIRELLADGHCRCHCSMPTTHKWAIGYQGQQMTNCNCPSCSCGSSCGTESNLGSYVYSFVMLTISLCQLFFTAASWYITYTQQAQQAVAQTPQQLANPVVKQAEDNFRQRMLRALTNSQ